jgi:hypothetical protein
VESVSQGFEALSQLLENPRVRPKLFAFRDYFQSTRKQINLLRDYKELHDELHHLQRGCYEEIKGAIGRFQEDSEAGENLKDYRLTLNEFTERIRLIALRKSEAAAEAGRLQTTLANACGKLEKGLEGSDLPGLKEALKLLSRMLSTRPPLIDNSLHSTAQAMQLPELVGALQVVCEEMVNLHLDADKVSKFSVGVEALAQLNGSLKAMITVHHQWQDLDLELRRIEFSIEFSLEYGCTELGESWPELKERAAPLSEGNPDGWGADFRKIGAELDGALALRDPTRVNRPFKRYRRMAAERFFWIDKTLKDHCGELCSIGEPIDLVLEMIQ